MKKRIIVLTACMMTGLVLSGCSGEEGQNDDQASDDNVEETVAAEESSSDPKEDGEENISSSTEEAHAEEAASDSSSNSIDTYLQENYKVDQAHYETDVWESDSGVTNLTVNLMPDTEAYSQEMDKKFQNGQSEVEEDIESLFDVAARIMKELPEEKGRVDSVNWVSYDGESTVTLIQDYEHSEKPAGDDALSKYSDEQIEYARVWLQLGPNQDIDELNVRIIPAGEKLNPDDETSAVYPEDVIQLAGSRLVDGSVTYSGNGDGTINVYNVPLRWDGKYPAGKDFYNEIIESTKLVPVETAEDEEVIRLIQLQKIQ
ncbi:hypothetical protein [Bacillus sp. SB49]|uniref:hypothetical protein n=1 Tax=Bacillus sp. SB49 TaxID=1071080 RepID=UPI000417EF59